MATAQQSRKDIARRYITDVVEPGNLDRLPEFVAEDVVNHNAVSGVDVQTEEESGLEAFRTHVEAIVDGLSDRKFEIEDVITEGDRVMVRFVVSGTHNGPMLGVEPTGKRVRFSGIVVYRIVDGKIVERWSESNTIGLYEQLGALPPR